MIADHYFTSGGYFTSHSVFLLYNQSNLSVIGFTQQTDKLELRLSALVSRLINWNLQRGAHPEQRCHSEPARRLQWESPSKFRTIYRHPFVGDGFPVPRNSETCMGRDGKPVPYDAFAVGPTNSQFLSQLFSADNLKPRLFGQAPYGQSGVFSSAKSVYHRFFFLAIEPRIFFAKK